MPPERTRREKPGGRQGRSGSGDKTQGRPLGLSSEKVSPKPSVVITGSPANVMAGDHSFDIGDGETLTIDTGVSAGTDITFTASASANAAIASLQLLPPSKNREIAEKALRAVAQMTDKELTRELGLLAVDGEIPDERFRNLPAAAVRTYIEQEIKVRDALKTNKRDWEREAFVALIGGAVVLLSVYLGYWLSKSTTIITH